MLWFLEQLNLKRLGRAMHVMQPDSGGFGGGGGRDNQGEIPRNGSIVQYVTARRFCFSNDVSCDCHYGLTAEIVVCDLSQQQKMMASSSDWREMMERQISLQQQILTAQNQMIQKLSEQNDKTNRAINQLSTQVRVLQAHIVDGKNSQKSKSLMGGFDGRHIGRQLATLQASLLWSQRNVRLVKANLRRHDKERASSATKQGSHGNEKKGNMSERLNKMQESIAKLESHAESRVACKIEPEIGEQNIAIAEKLRVDKSLKQGVDFVRVPRSHASHNSSSSRKRHQRNPHRLFQTEHKATDDVNRSEASITPVASETRDHSPTLKARALMQRHIDSWTSKKTVHSPLCYYNHQRSWLVASPSDVRHMELQRQEAFGKFGTVAIQLRTAPTAHSCDWPARGA
eukprot:jgi/Bigna1/71958/fgenesh1_pg.17_\